jgi:putative phage-type endonuclease
MSQSLTGDPQIKQAQRLLASEYAEQRSQEWLDLRDNMITASDIASAIGENHYETPDAFVKKKVLRTKWAGNAATAHGTLLEPMVRDLYDARTGRKSHEIGLVIHRDYPWLGASPDGVTEDGILIEIKCPLTRKIEPKVPKHYLPQVQLQLEVTDLEECDFIQYRPGDPEEFVITRVTRDRAWFAQHLPAMKASWERVRNGREHGLCEILDEPEFKDEIVCEIVDDDAVPPQEQNPHVPGVCEPVLCQVHST